VMLDLQACLL